MADQTNTPAGMKNIGTADAPLLIPIGSAADIQYTQNQQNQQGASGSTGQTFNVTAPATFPADVTKTAFGANAPTAEDIRQSLADKEAAQKELISAQTPTAVENDLNGQLIDIRSKIDQSTLDEATKYITNANRGILTDVAVGQANAQKQLDELKIQGLKLTESNLTQRLGLEQSKRQSLIDTVKTKLGFATDKFDTLMKIQDKIDQQSAALVAQTDKLSDNARATLASIMDNFTGLDYKDLDASSQAQITKLAVTAGIPLDLLVKGMEVAKNAAMAKALKDAQASMTTDEKEYQFAQSQGFKGSFLDWQKTMANLKTPRTTINYGATKDAKVTAALSQVAPAISAIRGPDGFVNPYGYKDLYTEFVKNNPGFGDEFIKQYPIEIYINPRDKQLFNK